MSDEGKDPINPHGVKVGQIWQNCDRREARRYLLIKEVIPLDAVAIVARVNANGGAIWGHRAPRPIKLRRFMPTHTGYRLVKDVTP